MLPPRWATKSPGGGSSSNIPLQQDQQHTGDETRHKSQPGSEYGIRDLEAGPSSRPSSWRYSESGDRMEVDGVGKGSPWTDGTPRDGVSPAQRDGRSSRGEGRYMQKGAYAGKWIRYSLEVAQQPVNGRRRTEKDRRPLTHCPILRLRLYDCHQISTGEWMEDEIDIVNVEPGSMLCAADLLDNDDSETPPQAKTPSISTILAPTPTNPSDIRNLLLPEPESMSSSSSLGPPDIPHSSSLPNFSDGQAPGVSSSTKVSPMGNFRDQQDLRPATTASSSAAVSGKGRTVIDRSSSGSSAGDAGSGNRKPSTKRQKQGRERNLFGNVHVTAVRVPAPTGELALWFLFSDLSIRVEGAYRLRFRVFDVTSVISRNDEPTPPLITAVSEPFTVYSPRNFPNPPKSTELADHFAKHGFKLTTRKNEKQAKTGKQSVTSTSISTSKDQPPQRPDPGPVQHSHQTSGSSRSHPSQSSSQQLGDSGRLPSNQTDSSGSGFGSGSGGSIPQIQHR